MRLPEVGDEVRFSCWCVSHPLFWGHRLVTWKRKVCVSHPLFWGCRLVTWKRAAHPLLRGARVLSVSVCVCA